jgi:glutathione S-transferase
MTLKLHVFPPSPRAFKVLAIAAHLGVDYEFSLCDLTKGDQKQAAFTAINPNQKMPALEEDGFQLWESNAIIMYLAGKRPGALVPADERGRADVLRWMFWDSTTWDPACATLVFERVVKGLFGGGPPDPAELGKGLRKFNFAAGVLDAHLKGRDHVCGDALSLADFALASALTMAEPAKFPLDAYAEIRRWSARMASLPAWRAARALQAPAAAA